MAQEFLIKVKVDPSGAKRGLSTVDRQLDKTQKKASAVGGALKKAFLFLGAGAALAGSIKLLADFGQEMSTVKAITQATGTEFAALSEEAKRLGATTRFSASEAAQGMVSLARAGLDASQTLAATESTLNLAQAGALDLGTAADIATNVLTGFRMEVGELGQVVDVLALGANSANTDVRQFGESMKFVAPVAAGLKIPLEETAVAVQALANAGLKGGLGGRGLRTLIAELQSPSEALANTLGMTVEELDKFKVSEIGFIESVRAMADAGLKAENVFDGLENSAATAFLALSGQDGNLDAMRANLDAAGGSAKRIADIMDDNLKGSILALRSAIQGFILELGDSGATGVIRKFVDVATGVFRRMTKAIDKTFGEADEYIRDVAGATDLAINGFQGLAVIMIGQVAGKAIPAVLAGLKALKIALLTNPLTFFVSGIALAIGALVTFRDELVLSEATGLTVGDALAASWEVMRDRLLFVVKAISRAWPVVRDAAVGAFQSAAKAVEEWLNNMGTSTSEVVGQLFEIFRFGFNKIVGVFSGLVGIFRDNLNRIKDTALVIWEFMSRAWKSTVEFFVSIFGSATEDVGQTMQDLGQITAETFTGIVDDIQEASRELQAMAVPEDLGEASLKQLGIRLAQIHDPVDRINTAIAIFAEEMDRNFFGEMVDGVTKGFDAIQAGLKESLLDLGFTQEEIDAAFSNIFVEAADKAGELAGKRFREKFFIPEPPKEFVGPPEPPPGFNAADFDLETLDAGVRLEEELANATARQTAAMEDQAMVLDAIQGPMLDLIAAKEALIALDAKSLISAEEYAAAMLDVNAAIAETSGTISGGFEAGLLRSMQNLHDVSSVAEQTVVNAFGAAEDALVKFVTTGKGSLKELVSSVIADLARLAARKLLLDLLGTLFPGGSAIGGFLGFAAPKAEGGPVLGNRSYLVGEEGPEILTPRGAGNITPAGETAALMAGGRQEAATVNVPPAQPVVNNYIVDDPNEVPNAMRRPEVEQEVVNLIARKRNTVKGVLQ